MYKKGDVVIIQSNAGAAIPQVEVRLIERVIVKPQKGRTFDWPLSSNCQRRDSRLADEPGPRGGQAAQADESTGPRCET